MAVAMASSNSSSTPDWRAALRARNKEKKEQSPAGVSSAKREEPAAKSTPPWVRKNAISKSGTLESSPNTKRTLFGAPKQGTASAARATNGLNSLVGAAERQPGVHSSTLPRSFGRAEVAAAAAATGPASSSSSTSTAATTSRALDDSAAGRSTLASTLDPGRGTNAKSSEDRPSVSRLRDMFSKSDKAEKSSSPKQAPRPRSMVTSGQKPSRVGKSPSSASGSPATSQSVASSTPKKHLDSPTHGVPLKKISEERSSAVLSASVAEQLSSQSRNQPPVAPQTQATPSQSADSTNESLECTNIDDFVMEKGLSARSFSMNAVEMLKAIGSASAPVTPQDGSPYERRRRNSILMTPERKVSKSNLKRRVSFSEMNLETVHQFQREEIRHSDDSDDENTRVMLKRVTIIDDEPDGPTTELHPMLSPLGGAKPPKKAWTPSNLMVQEPDDDDAPPDMYTDVSEDVAALMW